MGDDEETETRSRLGPVAIGTILSLRKQGKTLDEIRKAPFVRKVDGKRPSQQAVAYQIATKKASKARGTFTPNAGTGRTGRPKKLTTTMEKKIVDTVKKHRFARVRAPWVKKKLRVRASLRTVQRTIHDAGYWLPKLIQKRVLDKATKRKRVAWSRCASLVVKCSGALVPRIYFVLSDRVDLDEEHWEDRGYGDGHYWHVARDAAEMAGVAGAKKGPVYRKSSEKNDPRFHGGSQGVYAQGRRVGVFGILRVRDGAGRLHTAFLGGDKARINGKVFAKVRVLNGQGRAPEVL